MVANPGCDGCEVGKIGLNIKVNVTFQTSIMSAKAFHMCACVWCMCGTHTSTCEVRYAVWRQQADVMGYRSSKALPGAAPMLAKAANPATIAAGIACLAAILAASLARPAERGGI